MNKPLHGQVALLTGASRGIGAATALLLAERGADVVINYRSKASRAGEVAAEAASHGVRAIPVQADITIESDVQAMMERIRQEFGKLDILVLNASGGLEREMVAENPDYPLLLNRDAQVWTLEHALPLMPRGGRVVFVTSHWAHFYGKVTQYAVYEPVAHSKHEGELALLARAPDLDARGIRLARISGDLVEGTITPKLMERVDPGLMDARRQAAGKLPTVDDMAAAIVRAIEDDDMEQGGIIYVGETNVT
jgi:NAD(P)-dependent dehydrogenase (short-subunit alcohol dehydrogenase family)